MAFRRNAGWYMFSAEDTETSAIFYVRTIICADGTKIIVKPGVVESKPDVIKEQVVADKVETSLPKIDVANKEEPVVGQSVKNPATNTGNDFLKFVGLAIGAVVVYNLLTSKR